MSFPTRNLEVILKIQFSLLIFVAIITVKSLSYWPVVLSNCFRSQNTASVPNFRSNHNG